MITARIDESGTITEDPSLADENVIAAERLTVDGIDHSVASPFWDFMTASGTIWNGTSYIEAPLFEFAYYATGYPLTEAYWSTITVGGQDRLVLWQCVERRCLTYTPGNPVGFETEAGNVGLHYDAWRYGDEEPNPAIDLNPISNPDRHGHADPSAADRNANAGAADRDTDRAARIVLRPSLSDRLYPITTA